MEGPDTQNYNTMKRSEKKNIGKGILNGILSFAKGVTIGNPLINMVIGGVQGIVKGVQKTKVKNLESEVGGVGKVDYSGAIGAITGAIIVIGGSIALAKGWLTSDQLKDIFGLWLRTQ